MPRFKLRPNRPPRLIANISIGVAGTLTVNTASQPTPLWSAAPVFTVVAGQDSGFLSVPVSAGAGTVSVTLGWHSSNTPSTKPAWVEFQHGTAPKIRFSGGQADANDMSSLVLMATASGQTVLSSTAGTGSLTVLPSSEWAVTSISFTEGTAGQTYQLSPPYGAQLNGIYAVASGALPGISVSETGLVTYDGSAAAGSATFAFSYTEPAALPTLTLHPALSGTLPYMATVYPAESAVPSGMSIVSPDDITLRAAVLSVWPDNSARVMVVAGNTALTNGVTKEIALRTTTVTQTPLTLTHLQNCFSNSVAVRCTFDSVNYDLTKASLTTADWTWWANEQVICARYRIPVTGKGSLEAVIDVHAFAGGRAFVEVVIENGKLTATAPVKPTLQTYTGATVSVNGTTIATVTSPTAGTTITNATGQTNTWTSTGHEAFRAWYASTWIGGDPGIDVTHDTASMQKHPMLFRVDKASSVNLDTTYGSDAYARWDTGRYQPSMGGGGDAAHIGILPHWEVQYLQSGNKTVRNAIVTNALKALTFDLNYRDVGGYVPNFTQVGNKSVQGSQGWPANYAKPSTNKSGAGHTHCPQIGLMAFLCRPSPCFIELAQKACLFNATWTNRDTPLYGTSMEVRGKAWGLRDHAVSVFLTPDSHAWKAAAQTKLGNALTGPGEVYTPGWNEYITRGQELNVAYQMQPGNLTNRPGYSGTNQWFSLFENYYFLQAAHMAANAKVLTGQTQTDLVALADWMAVNPVKYVNDAVGGEFRYHFYEQIVGTNVNAGRLTSQATWAQQLAAQILDSVPATSGPMMQGGSAAASWATGTGTDSSAGALYPSYFWAALCIAVERGVSGADAAWTKFYGNGVDSPITNLSVWRNGFAAQPRWGYYPRNK